MNVGRTMGFMVGIGVGVPNRIVGKTSLVASKIMHANNMTSNKIIIFLIFCAISTSNNLSAAFALAD